MFSLQKLLLPNRASGLGAARRHRATSRRLTPGLRPMAVGCFTAARTCHLNRFRLHVSGAAAGPQGNELPRDWTQVMSWSRDEFRRCVAADSPSAPLHLAKACLLVALEEEAAASGEAPHPELAELLEAAQSSGRLRPRSAASASTWSGERLEALAAEVAALLDQQLEESAAYRVEAEAEAADVKAADMKAADAAAAVISVEGPCFESDAAAAGCDAAAATAAAAAAAPPDEARHGPVRASSCHTLSGGSTGSGTDATISAASNTNHPSAATSEPGSETTSSTNSSGFDFAAEQEQLLDRIRTSRPGAVGSSSSGGSSSSSNSSSAKGRTGSGRISPRDDGGNSNSDISGSGNSSGGGAGGEDLFYGSAWPSGRRVYGRRQALYWRYPIHTLAAVNTVLFDRHGYLPCNRYGVPSDHRLSAVLERGVGASAALSILYLEVCERLGFPLAARPLEDGRYFVLWPMGAPLTADGQRFLVDPYGRGGLLLLDEVCEIFGVEQSALRPAPRRELLAALLGELRDSHWAAAAGCSAQPGAMTPLAVATALENKVSVPASGVRAASLRRALAAAEKRLWLLPDDSEAQLQYGLLLYFSRRYDDAWIELALYLERFGCGGGGFDGGGDVDGGKQPSAPLAGAADAAAPSGSAAAAAPAMEADPDEDPGPNSNKEPDENQARRPSVVHGGGRGTPAERRGEPVEDAPVEESQASESQRSAVAASGAMSTKAAAAAAVSNCTPPASATELEGRAAEQAAYAAGAANDSGAATAGNGGSEVGGNGLAVGGRAAVDCQVALLVERIRLVLELTPVPQVE